MKNKVKKLCFSLFAIMFAMSVLVIKINAVPLGGKLINGPRNILYTVNGYAVDYVYNINAAVYNSMYTGYDNPIYMYPVSDTSGTTVDFYTSRDNTPYINYRMPSSTIAVTFFFNNHNETQYWTSDYLWNMIIFNDYYHDDQSINHDAIAAHELGHVLGLADVYGNADSSKTIMYGYGNLMKVFRPTKADNDEIVALYGRR